MLLRAPGFVALFLPRPAGRLDTIGGVHIEYADILPQVEFRFLAAKERKDREDKTEADSSLRSLRSFAAKFPGKTLTVPTLENRGSDCCF